MTNFWKNAGRGYMTIAGPFNTCWSYLFSRKWCHSAEDTLSALVLLAVLILISPFAYMYVAPVAALIEGIEEEGEPCL